MRPNWFVGWPIDCPALIERLGGPPEGVRLFAPSDIHVTLAFLGPVDETRAVAAFEALHTEDLGAIDVTFGAVGLMGHPRRGTALAAIVRDPEDSLERAIAARRDPVLEAAGAPPDDRPPRPHATIARIGRRANPPTRRAAIRWSEHVDLSGLGACLDRIALFTWSHDRARAQFRVVRERHTM
ncbi:MAG: 2'-5' RNA ligase family protein [Sandaracinaceae bacterium]